MDDGTTLSAAARYLLAALLATGTQILVLLGPGLVLALVMHRLAGLIERRSYRLLGRRPYLALFGWLGTAVHELGHALFCLLFGHRIEALCLFRPDPRTGTLGYVRHAYRRSNPWHQIGRFFIGIGPIVLGTLVIFAAARLLIGPAVGEAVAGVAVDSQAVGRALGSAATAGTLLTAVGDATGALLASVFALPNLLRWQFYLFLYLSFAVGGAITLSRSDIEGAARGFAALAGLLLLFNLSTLWLGDFATRAAAQAGAVAGGFYALMLFALALNAAAAVAVLLLPAAARAAT